MNTKRLLGVVVLGAAVLAGLGLLHLYRARAHARQADSAANAVEPPNPEAIRYPTNVAEMTRLFDEIKVWGKWGPADQLGAVNLITDSTRKNALALVRLGRQISLEHPVLTASSATPAEAAIHENGKLAEHIMGRDFTTDTYSIDYHSFIHTHLDALCHFSYNGRSYNGYPSKEINTANGCTKLGVENLRNGLVTRGVLVDIPRLRNLPYLEPGTPVFAEDIEAWEKMAGVKIGPGDAVFLRTGRWERWNKVGPWNVERKEAGFHPSVAAWFAQRGVALVGSDDGLDVLPSPVAGMDHMPLHALTLVALGIPIIDNLDLEELARTTAELHRWEFLVTVAPLVVVGGTGSPVNTVAMF